MPNIYSSSLAKKRGRKGQIHLNKIRLWKIYNNLIHTKDLMKRLEKKNITMKNVNI